ncbi:hypothetical protein AB6A40_010958 [Gnathostoma spinigerum]|uniref:Uncharacterized protein n=1 Tax=Gnathostoma spinigerum TaxID=75299 RepID=A0ABD6F0V7_9BILA
MESGDEISSRLNSILAAEKHGLTSEELISQYKYMWGTDLRSMKNKSSDLKSMIRNLPKAPVLKDDRWFANDCEELHDMIKLVKETKSKNKAWRSSSKKKCDVCKDITKKDHNAFNTKIESKSGKLDKVLLDCKKPPSIAGCRKSQPILPEKSVQFSHSSKIGPPINLPSLEQRPSFSAKGQERLVTLINLLGGECRLNELKRQYFKQYQVALDLREIRRLSGIGDKDQRTEEELLKDFLTGRAVMDNSVNPLFTTVSDDEYYASDDDVELCDDPVDHGTLTVSRTSNIEAHLVSFLIVFT